MQQQQQQRRGGSSTAEALNACSTQNRCPNAVKATLMKVIKEQQKIVKKLRSMMNETNDITTSGKAVTRAQKDKVLRFVEESRVLKARYMELTAQAEKSIHYEQKYLDCIVTKCQQPFREHLGHLQDMLNAASVHANNKTKKTIKQMVSFIDRALEADHLDADEMNDMLDTVREVRKLRKL